MKKILALITVLLVIGLQFANGQLKQKKIKDKGYLIFHESTVVFIPSKEIKDSLFLNKYNGDTGYKIGENEYVLRFKEKFSKYNVVTNYLINDSLVSEKKLLVYSLSKLLMRYQLQFFNGKSLIYYSGLIIRTMFLNILRIAKEKYRLFCQYADEIIFNFSVGPGSGLRPSYP